MKNDPTDKPFSERRLDRASKHVSSLWFPINPKVLSSLRANFAASIYEKTPDKLLEDLKKDFALFTFIVKELMPVATKEHVEASVIDNPVELIRWAGPNRIGAIVNDDSALPRNHVFAALEPFQAARLRETAIIASTAEVLSESHNLDPETGFCHGVIREIGLNLIAWNYPTLYARMVKDLKPDQTLDEVLSSELGFSPSLLAMRVLRPHADQLSQDPEFEKLSKSWASYDQLCEIGEALARAEHPETYPSAENDWKMASAYLKKTVGDRGIDLVRNRAVEHSQEYQRTLNSLFKSLEEFHPENKIQRHRRSCRAKSNKYLAQCTPEVQSALQNLYASMINAQSARSVLESLLHTVIPQAGFTGGCVFVVDPALMSLVPRTVFGNVKLRRLHQVRLHRGAVAELTNSLVVDSLTTDRAETDLAATALSCHQPVIEHNTDASMPNLTGIYGSLGDLRRIGVLYLEAPESWQASESNTSIFVFKAMRQALADALQLD